MWAAISSVVALTLVAALNIGVLVLSGGPSSSPAGQVLTTAIWALQAPLAGILIAARSARKDVEQVHVDASGENVFALAVLYGVTIFVLIQTASVAFGGAIFIKDYLFRTLCAQGHQDRCAQIPSDALGALSGEILVGGGVFVTALAMLFFGVAGYRIGWRARSLRWLGAVLTPVLTTLLLLAENLISLFAFGGDVDASLAGASALSLALSRAPIAGAGIVAGLIGFALSLRVNRPARRYAFAIASISRRKTVPASVLKTELLALLGFSAREYELLVRRKPATDGAKTKE